MDKCFRWKIVFWRIEESSGYRRVNNCVHCRMNWFTYFIKHWSVRLIISSYMIFISFGVKNPLQAYIIRKEKEEEMCH